MQQWSRAEFPQNAAPAPVELRRHVGLVANRANRRTALTRFLCVRFIFCFFGSFVAHLVETYAFNVSFPTVTLLDG